MIYDKSKEIGVNLLEGFKAGFESIKEKAKETVTGFFGGVVSGVKGLLGIHSPSTVFKGIGENTAKGFEQGLEDGKAGVIRTAESLGEEVVEAVEKQAEPAKVAGETVVMAVKEGVESGSPEVIDAFDDVTEVRVEQADTTADMIKSSISSAFTVFGDLANVIAEGGSAWDIFAAAGLEAIASVLDGLGELLAVKAAEATTLALFGDLTKIPAAIAASAGAAAAYSAAGFVRSKIPSYDVGGMIQRDHVAQVHAGETILPKGITADMRNAGLQITPLGGAVSQSQTFNAIIQMDGRTVARQVFKYTDESVGLAYVR